MSSFTSWVVLGGLVIALVCFALAAPDRDEKP